MKAPIGYGWGGGSGPWKWAQRNAAVAPLKPSSLSPPPQVEEEQEGLGQFPTRIDNLAYASSFSSQQQAQQREFLQVGAAQDRCVCSLWGQLPRRTNSLVYASSFSSQQQAQQHKFLQVGALQARAILV